jgi:undecaprenyl-diphosphatase
MESLHALDLGVLYFVGSLHRPWLDPLALSCTRLGDRPVLAAVVLAAAGVFLLLRRGRFALVLAAAALLGLCVEQLTKQLVGRPRPQVRWALVPAPGGPSFPSGHTLCATAVYVCLGLLAGRLLGPPWGRIPVALGVTLALLVGFTRPYLGVHYPLDVLGGWLAGLACALLGAGLAGEPA